MVQLTPLLSSTAIRHCLDLIPKCLAPVHSGYNSLHPQDLDLFQTPSSHFPKLSTISLMANGAPHFLTFGPTAI